MLATQTKAVATGSVGRRTALQLFFCHSLIFFVGLVFKTSTLPLLGACLFSFLLTLNFPYNLHLLEITLDRLARGLPVEPVPSRLRGPMQRLFALANTLGQQTEQQVQMKESTLAYRDQLLQQVSKTAAQEERNRLARDLHDSIKQHIFSIAISAAAIKVRWERDLSSVRKIVDEIERTALEAQVEMQALLQQLRPVALENVGLLESLRMQCQALSYRTGAEVIAELSELPVNELLPPGTQEMIFRIVQEGFTNIARHARASVVWLSLRRQRDTLLVEIGDDGQGFDLTQAPHERASTYGGMGISNVRERVRSLGGTLTLWSLPDKGTTLHLCIPLARPQEDSEAQLASTSLAMALNTSRLILRSGALAAELAAGFVLFYTPATLALWAVGSCTFFALIFWLWSQLYASQLAVEFGREDEERLLLRTGRYGLLSGILALCLLELLYLASLSFPLLASNRWLLISASGVLLLALLLTTWRGLQSIDAYYRTRTYQALRAQLRKQRQQMMIDWLACASGATLSMLLAKVFPAILKEPAVYALGLLALSAWLIILLAKMVYLMRWQRQARIAAQKQPGGSL